MKLSKESSYNIQIIRGFSIIAVVLIHNTPNGLAQVFCRPFLNFCVGTFLFLSGMLSNAKSWNPAKRIKKIIIPYIVWTCIYTVIKYWEQPMRIPTMLLLNLLVGRAAAMMYYVFIYSELTLIIPMIDRLAKSKFWSLGFLVSPLEIIVMRVIPILTGTTINQYVFIAMNISFIGWFSYFYLGYLLGNEHIKLKSTSFSLSLALVASIGLQIFEGYLYLYMGEQNCGTQLKLSALLSGMIFVMISFRLIKSQDNIGKFGFIYNLGNCSFGIFFSHLAVMSLLDQIPGYSLHVLYPINGIIALFISWLLVLSGRKILRQWSKYFAFT